MRDFCMDLGTYTRHAGLEALQMSILLIVVYTYLRLKVYCQVSGEVGNLPGNIRFRLYHLSSA